MKKVLIVICILLIASATLPQKLLLLPPSGDANKIQDVKTIQILFMESLQQFHKGSIIASPDSEPKCESAECAAARAKEQGADQAVYTIYRKLGEKWIIVATIVNADGSGVYNLRGSAEKIEDFEPLTNRLADALINHKSLDQSATIDNITEMEGEKEPNRRKGLYSGGLSIGYLYPSSKSFSYYQEKEGFNWMDTSTYELKTYSQLVKLGWINSWEIKPHLAMNLELVWHVPIAFGSDINCLYLMNNTDFTPFVGGGLGIYYVKADANEDSFKDKRNSGPSLNAQAGVMFFRTYNIHLMLRAQYQWIFNSDLDNGLSWDMSVVYQQPRSEGSEERASLGSYWKYYLLFGLVGIIAATAIN